MTYEATCQVCEDSGEWSSEEYRDSWVRWHADLHSRGKAFTIDRPDTPQQTALRRARDRSDSIAATVRESIRKQREEQGQ